MFMNDLWADLLRGIKLLWGSFAFLMNFTAIVFICGLIVFVGSKTLTFLCSFLCSTASKMSAKKISLDQFEVLQQFFLMACAILFFIVWLLLVAQAISWFGLDNLWRAGFFYSK